MGDRYLVAGFDSGDLRAWRLGSGRRDQTGFTIQTGEVTGLIAMPDGRVVMSSDADGVVHSWDVNTGEFIERRQISDSSISALAVSPNGDYVVAGTNNKYQIWHQGNEIVDARVPATSIAITPDNKRIVAARGDESIDVVGLITGEPAGEFTSLGDAIDVIAVTPDGRQLLGGRRCRGVAAMGH